MSRLIDAEHFEQMLIDSIDNGDHKNAYVHHAYKMRNIAIKECRKMLWEEPTVDAVPVVRCGECRHKYLEHDVWMCLFGLLIPSSDGFCSYGEKVTE